MSTTREKDIEAGIAKHGAVLGEPEAFADGCAHRDRQVVAYLRERAKLLDYSKGYQVLRIADAIERGEHVT